MGASRQLEMFATATTPSSSIVTIKLERPADPGHRRCDSFATIGSSRGPHHAVLTCRSCGKFRGWLGKREIEFINETRARFGALEIITIRSFPRTSPGAGGRDIAERRQPKKGPETDMRSYAAKDYIKLDHVAEGPLVKTIASIEPGSFDKPAVTFDDGSQLSLNRTSVLDLSKAFGWDSAEWIGRRVEIYQDEIKFNGGTQPGIRVRPAPEPNGNGDLNDDIGL
jgi:hypothetical protein